MSTKILRLSFLIHTVENRASSGTFSFMFQLFLRFNSKKFMSEQEKAMLVIILFERPVLKWDRGISTRQSHPHANGGRREAYKKRKWIKSSCTPLDWRRLGHKLHRAKRLRGYCSRKMRSLFLSQSEEPPRDDSGCKRELNILLLVQGARLQKLGKVLRTESFNIWVPINNDVQFSSRVEGSCSQESLNCDRVRYCSLIRTHTHVPTLTFKSF